jgi:hypothetical protein
MRFSDEVSSVLRSAGWEPGRRVPTADWEDEIRQAGLAVHDALRDFLAEFGGLKVDQRGPGISVARAPFEFDPAQAGGDEDRFAEWSETEGVQLCPIGVVEHTWLLGIDERSNLYQVTDILERYGPVDQALSMLVLGIKPQRIA